MAQRLVYGAAILFSANLINKFLGFAYQYLVMRYIGSEAYGLFYMVFPVYMTRLSLSHRWDSLGHFQNGLGKSIPWKF
jgi:O-antigen/teichoic acid export membrane protein